MNRRHGFYWSAFAACFVVLAGAWTGVVLLDDSPWQLGIAAVLGVVFAQFGFLGHEACHRQVFRSGRWNEWAGRVVSGLLVGLSYGWWMSKHSRHHAAPNQLGKDPDIDSVVVAFHAEAAVTPHRIGRWLGRRQGWLFLPLLAFEGLSLHAGSVRRLLGRDRVNHRAVEIVFMAVRVIGYLVAVFWLLPPGLGVGFVAVQLAVFGVLLGGAFAPNHIGMPIVPRTARIDFLRRQVLMSRNIRGGFGVRFVMGGLDAQIEHHLFPAMPRPNLHRARVLVRQYCADHDITYTETTLGQAYRSVLTHLNRVGVRQRDTFGCPISRQLR